MHTSTMALMKTAGQPRSSITVLTVLVLIASFSLAVGSLWTAYSAVEQADKPFHDVYSLFPAQSIEPALLADTDDFRGSLQRTDFLKFFTPWTVNSGKSACFVSRFRIGSRDGFISNKETILLKLRI